VSQRSIAEVLLAVAGVYLIVARIPEFGIGIVLLANRDDSPGATNPTDLEALSLVVPIVSAGVGALLLALRQSIARLLFAAPASPGAPFSLRELQGALFAVVGAYVTIQGVAHLIQGALALEPHQSLVALWPSYAGPLFQAAAGLALFFGARGLAGAWAVARHAGHDRAPREGAV